ncbi:hypothetical protein PUNSTDRAFT_129796 [Punctularia strigosozonata HHB-11173 SS5]|uniref:uncharacterized protein n=1 Tax=Punctularia strigosozonata (strain HHB-11173) TaxID=741275 RepID=UPI00044170FA|nr:uncharacterized protein PUNSTDRAFT_129796 [Punctularia strigosozonata HHB-11173 SS5]EIN14160.1 hypothetical protein PUNSTDRAFT_129796 [Punctularia strigosozonata HHB-11173 SS5]
MPKVNTTIDDTSPLIQYGNGWIDEGDGIHDNFNGTITFCTAAGTSLSFSFNGTGVWIFGPKRSDHGYYTVMLDDGPNTTFSGFAPEPGLDHFPLFNGTDLLPGSHTITLTNTCSDSNKTFLGVDFITWESEQGATDAPVTNTTIDDKELSFVYEPAAAWSVVDDASTGFSGHRTIADASSTLTFNGNGVTIYGGVGAGAGLYTVQVDGGPVSHYNASRTSTNDTILFFTNSLDDGKHVVQLVNDPGTSGTSLSVDFAIVSTTTGQNATLGTGPSPPKPRFGNGVLAAIAICVSMAVAGIFGFGFYFWYRRRKAKRRFQPVDLIGSPVVPPTHPPPLVSTQGGWKPQIEDTVVRPYILDIPVDPSHQSFSDGHGGQMVEVRSPKPAYIRTSVASPRQWDPHAVPQPTGPIRGRESFAGPQSATSNRSFLPERARDAETVMIGPPSDIYSKRSYGSAGSLGTSESVNSTASLLRTTRELQYPSIARLSVTAELPEPRSPANTRPPPTPSRFSIANPDISPIDHEPTAVVSSRAPVSTSKSPLPNPHVRSGDSRRSKALPLPPIMIDRRPDADAMTSATALSDHQRTHADHEGDVSPQPTLPPNYYEET